MNDPSPAKRPRLSMACNECRRRKVRCDTGYPKCHNCNLRSETCTTTDPKRPQVEIVRVWIDVPEPPPAASRPKPTASDQDQRDHEVRSPPDQQPWTPVVRPNPSPSAHSPTATSTKSKRGTEISAAQQPHDMAFNTEPSTDRVKMMGASSSQCLMKTFDAYLNAARIEPVAGFFRHGMREAEEMEIPLINALPPLPDLGQCNAYLNIFFDKIHPLYPLFEVDQFRQTVQRLSMSQDLQSLPREQVPMLVSAYLVCSIGADEHAQQLTSEGTMYLAAAASLLGHVIVSPYLPAVQTLILFAIIYRGRNKDGLGWQTLGMAIRIAHTLGLHRHSAINPSDQHGVRNKGKQLFHARIWAICCSLEKIMELESGRPAIIETVDRDHMMSAHQHYAGPDFLQWHMGLAQYQGLISQHIYGHKPGDRTAQQILLDTAKLDRALLSWASEIPEEFRPGTDLFCSSREFHIGAFLSIQYYHTVIALHRAALISPAVTFLAEVANHCPDNASRLRLQAGEGICISSARSIARLSIELSDRNIDSRILSSGPLLLACIVLGISLMKNSGSRITSSDLELLRTCCVYTAEQFTKCGHNALFTGGITSIYQQVRLHIERKSRIQTGTPSRAFNPHQQPGGGGEQGINPPLGHQILVPGYGAAENIGNNNNNGLANTRISYGGSAGSENASRNNNNTTNNNTYNPNPLEANGILDNGSSLVGNAMPNGENNQGDAFSDPPLPFDNLNVLELWTWMDGMSDNDGYIYSGN